MGGGGGPERQRGRGRGIEGDGGGQPDVDHLLRDRAQRAVRSKQGHRRADGSAERDADHELHPHDQLRAARSPHGAGVACHGPDAAAHRPGCASPDAGRVQPEHHRHAGRQQLESGAQHLDDSVGLPEGCGGQQRHRAAARGTAGRVVLSSQPQGALGPALLGDWLHQQPEPGDARSRRASNTRSSATCWSSSSTRTTRT